MTLQGTATVDAPRERVFAALLDGEVLKRVFPGCEEFTPDGRVTISAGAGGFRGRAHGKLTVRESRPPEHYTLDFTGQGLGSSVGGTATIDLADAGSATHVTYLAEVTVGGLISALGDRMIEAAATRAIAHFFKKLSMECGGLTPPWTGEA